VNGRSTGYEPEELPFMGNVCQITLNLLWFRSVWTIEKTANFSKSFSDLLARLAIAEPNSLPSHRSDGLEQPLARHRRLLRRIDLL
jgi:hypothetical protein